MLAPMTCAVGFCAPPIKSRMDWQPASSATISAKQMWIRERLVMLDMLAENPTNERLAAFRLPCSFPSCNRGASVARPPAWAFRTNMHACFLPSLRFQLLKEFGKEIDE